MCQAFLEVKRLDLTFLLEQGIRILTNQHVTEAFYEKYLVNPNTKVP